MITCLTLHIVAHVGELLKKASKFPAMEQALHNAVDVTGIAFVHEVIIINHIGREEVEV